MGVQDFQKIRRPLFQEINSLEHARWTFSSRKFKLPFFLKKLPWARRLDVQGFQKSNLAKVIPYCKASKAVFSKRVSCVAQVTQGAYNALHRCIFCAFIPNSREFRHRGPNANFEYFWEKVEPITPSRTKFSNGLANNRSKVSVKNSQIGFVRINLSRSIFPYMSNIYQGG